MTSAADPEAPPTPEARLMLAAIGAVETELKGMGIDNPCSATMRDHPDGSKRLVVALPDWKR